MLDLKNLPDGAMTYTISCDNCDNSYYTSYSSIPPYAAANMVCIDEHTLCARCAKELYALM